VGFIRYLRPYHFCACACAGISVTSWGGEIELGILSQHFDVELCVVSMEPLYLLPFPGAKAKHYLLYTGQHYDPLVGAATLETSVDDEVSDDF
jgi:hypothetical protein